MLWDAGAPARGTELGEIHGHDIPVTLRVTCATSLFGAQYLESGRLFLDEIASLLYSCCRIVHM